MATTIASLFNPLGNAFGQVLPAIFVTQQDSSGHISGMTNLLIAEAVICFLSLAAAYVYFQEKPPTPPSHSAQVMLCQFDALSLP